MKKNILSLALLGALLSFMPSCNTNSSDQIVILHATMEIKPEHIDNFKKISQELIANTRKEEGCIRYTLLQDAYNPAIFTFYEEYKNADAVKLHSSQQYLHKFRELRQPMMIGSPAVLRYKASDVEL